MLCEIIFAAGLTLGCLPPPPPPPRDLAADVLVEQQSQQQAEVDAALAKRDKLYRGLNKCSDCGAVDTYPFPQAKKD
jgi:hypothetical protein